MVPLAYVCTSALKIHLINSANIHIKGSTVLQPQVSPFLDPVEASSFSPEPPTIGSSLPGDIIFRYAPLHPAHCNPRSSRRYLLTLLEQPKVLDPEMLRQEIASEVDRLKLSTQISIKGAENGLASEYNLRLGSEPIYSFISKHGLNVAAYGFIKSSWNLKSSLIFKSLGIF